jgi:hypothetical protein
MIRANDHIPQITSDSLMDKKLAWSTEDLGQQNHIIPQWWVLININLSKSTEHATTRVSTNVSYEPWATEAH